MKGEYSSQGEKTEYEKDRENGYKKIEDSKSLLSNSPKDLEEVEKLNKINKSNGSPIREKKGSMNDKEFESKNRIEEEELFSIETIKTYEEEKEYNFKMKPKDIDRLSIIASKGSDSNRRQNLKSYLYLPSNKTYKKIYKEKYIIDLRDKLDSNVFKGKNKENNKELVFKFEEISFDNDLINEAHILIDLYKIERIPKIIDIDILGHYNILVMNYIGPSLQDCLEKCDGKFTLGTTLKISIQILNIIKQIHEKGIVLRYLKPENMLVGTGENKDYIYLIDFGLARKVIIDGEHIKFGKAEHILGNKNFISINLHNYIEATRRDDIESLGYNLIYFMKESFPWKGYDREETKEKKINIPLEELCSGLPNEFKEFIEYGRKLEFSEKPDYDFLNNLLLKVAEKNKIDINSVKYDWDVKNEEILRFISKIKLRDAESIKAIPAFFQVLFYFSFKKIIESIFMILAFLIIQKKRILQ